VSRRQSSALPPPTERLHPAAEGLDLEPIAAIVRRLHREDLRAVQAAGRAQHAIAALAHLVVCALAQGGRLVYVGAGTSGRLGALDAAECPPTFGSRPGQVVALIAGGPPALRRAVEGAEDDARAGGQAVRGLRVGKKDVVCGISASGRTAFVQGALAAARRAGAKTALVSCNPSLRVPTDVHVRLNTGPELIAGSTRLKAATATKVVLNAVSTAAFVGLGRVYRGRMVDARPTNAKLRARAERMIVELAGVSAARARALLAKSGTASAALGTGLRRLARSSRPS
jgi:N-acetylmuramic acid 6-phosphate etherase